MSISPKTVRVPTLQEQYSVAGATVPKSESYFTGAHNQDSLDRFTSPSGNMMVAAVFDGCGSQAHSHIGAHLGGRMLLRSIFDAVERLQADQKPLAGLDIVRIQENWGADVKQICEITGGADWPADMESRFEFTMLGVIMTADETQVFHVGDGFFSINGKTTVITSPNNAPSYPIYPFLPGVEAGPHWIKLEPVMKTTDVNSIVLTTDGGRYLTQEIDHLSGYQSTGELTAVLNALQRPRLVANPPEARVQPVTPTPQVQAGETRIDGVAKVDIGISMSYSAALERGPIGDDLAIIVITKNGAVRKHPAETKLGRSTQTDEGLIGKTLSGLRGLWGRK